MSFKTKILSLFLAALLVVPALLSPINNGSVKGVVEDRRQINGSSISNKKGEIAGGVIDYKNSSDALENEQQGLAILDLNAKASVSTNKFALASEIVVIGQDKTQDLIISNTDVELATDVLLSLDKVTFESLGGDSSKESEIKVVVRK